MGNRASSAAAPRPAPTWHHDSDYEADSTDQYEAETGYPRYEQPIQQSRQIESQSEAARLAAARLRAQGEIQTLRQNTASGNSNLRSASNYPPYGNSNASASSASDDNNRKLWLTGLPKHSDYVDEDFVYNCLSNAPGASLIEDIELCRNRQTNQILGFGTITFTYAAAADRFKAAVDGTVIPSTHPQRTFRLRPYRPRPATNAGSTPANFPITTAANSPRPAAATTSLTLRFCLDYSIRDDVLRQKLTSTIPGVTKVTISRAQDSKESLGYGFEFSAYEHLHHALREMDGMMIGRRAIRVTEYRQQSSVEKPVQAAAAARVSATSAKQQTAARQTSTNTKQPQPSTSAANADCCVCLTNPTDCVFYRCGHESACYACAQRVRRETGQCPICRAAILDVIKSYRT